MLKGWLGFYWSVLKQQTWQPNWLQSEVPDKAHFHRRRFTASYRNKQRLVRGLWFVFVLVVLAFPLPHVVVGLGLFVTFTSFSLLDETE